MKEKKQALTNKEYRKLINQLVLEIDQNDVLQYYYNYIREKEKIRKSKR